MSTELLVLVDEQDNPTGSLPKTEVHARGLLHRAFSVFIFNSKGDFLLQQRALDKYHSGGLWSNACCSHPPPGEDLQEFASKRLFDEMGIRCEIKKLFSFIYRASVGNGLIEHEFDHVFAGFCNDIPAPDTNEAAGWRYITSDQLQDELIRHPENFTEWFKICMDKYNRELNEFARGTLLS